MPSPSDLGFSDSDWSRHGAATASGAAVPAWLVLLAGVAIGSAITSLGFLLARHASQAQAAPPLASASAARPGAASASGATPSVMAALSTTMAAASEPEPSVRLAEPLMSEPPAAGVAPARAASTDPQRKERAWAQFYRRPAACEGNPTTDQLIECANHHIRARREFEERWKLQQQQPNGSR